MKRVNLSILLPAILLVLISLSTFYSLNIDLFKQQLIFLFVSLIFYFIFINIDFRIISFYSRIFYVLMILLLALLLLLGMEVKGATRWVEVFGINIQFSEVFKPFIFIFFATFLTSIRNKSLKNFITSLFLILPVFFLTLKQPDLGNALIYLFTLILMVFIVGFPLKYFLFFGIFSIISIPLLFQFLHDYQKERVYSFLNYSHDPSGSSYNAIQSMIAVGSGEIIGKGLGQATQSVLKFLPERHTDFIFATISESVGLVGSLLLLLIYFYFLYRILMITKTIHDEFANTLVHGFFFLFLIHIFFNVGMNIGVVPIVGITLPFVSYGGSSLLTNFIILAFISQASFEAKKNLSMEIR